MIPITSDIYLKDEEIGERFVRAAGPGGQNVNKVSTAVELRFDGRRSPSLPEAVRRRLATLAGNRITKDGIILISASSHRSQQRNREDALARLIELIRRAAIVPRKRRPTRPTRASKEARLETKARRGKAKRTRRPVTSEE
jgi:ribosome-associated protein